jgi:predicted SprT family Zn-dependent metalloprotease
MSSREFDTDKQGNPVLCRDCKQHIKMVLQDSGKWAPRNLDGSKHDHKAESKPGNSQVAMLDEQQIRLIVKDELAKFLQWMARQSEAQTKQ